MDTVLLCGCPRGGGLGLTDYDMGGKAGFSGAK
jgi:hypothetical protein